MFSMILCWVSLLSAAQAKPLLIKGGHYFDVHNGTMVVNRGILIESGRINGVGVPGGGVSPDDYLIVELEDDEYLLPAFIDLHAHYRIDAFGSDEHLAGLVEEFGYWIDEFKYNAVIYLANGVTSTFPAGVYAPVFEKRASELVSSGKWIGARMWRSGPYFGNARPGWDSRITEEQIYSEIDHWAFQGISGIKVKDITPEHLGYVLSRAHSHGLTVTGHLNSGYNNTTSSNHGIEMGIDRVEHTLGGYALDPSKPAIVVFNQLKTTSEAFKKTVRQFIDNSVYLDATMTAPVYFWQTELKEGFEYWVDERKFFTPYVQRLLLDKRSRSEHELMDGLYLAIRRTTKAFYDAGAGHLITLGTDTTSHGDFLGEFSAHREMHTMVLAGIPAESVLKIATINGARALRKGELIGSIDVGKLADLVVIQGNPLHDITNTRNTRLIVKSGTMYRSEELFAFVEGKIGPQDSDEVADWFKYQELLD